MLPRPKRGPGGVGLASLDEHDARRAARLHDVAGRAQLSAARIHAEADDRVAVLVGDTIVCFRVDPGSGKLSSTGNVVKRSEEHTSELQSQSNLVCRLLPDKK